MTSTAGHDLSFMSSSLAGGERVRVRERERETERERERYIYIYTHIVVGTKTRRFGLRIRRPLLKVFTGNISSIQLLY